MDHDAVYLTLEQVLAIHQDQIERYGGSHGLRDLTLLESAIFRPQTTFSGEDLYPTLFEKAGALLHSLLLNHPFLDENKRTATVSAIAFLLQNKIELSVSNTELVKVVLDIEAKKYTIESLGEWLEVNSTPIFN